MGNKQAINRLFFENLFSAIRRYWWIVVVITAVLMFGAYSLVSRNPSFESISIVHRWYDLDSGRIINERVAESLLNAVFASQSSTMSSSDQIQVQRIKGTEFLWVTARASSPQRAKASLERALSTILGGPIDKNVKNTVIKAKEFYKELLQDLDRTLATFQPKLAIVSADGPAFKSAKVSMILYNLVSPVVNDISSTRRDIQDALSHIRAADIREFAVSSDSILLSPTTPTKQLPSGALPIALLTGMAFLLMAGAIVIIWAAAAVAKNPTITSGPRHA